jgi:Bacterial pre-peptidase C-terminal domain
VEGPIRITTDGGTATLAGPGFASQPLVQFTGIGTTAAAGAAADATKASANTGQPIVLQGQGFTSQTLVQFTAVDDTGAVGTLTRTGQASSDGRVLTVEVPALAKTGQVRILGNTLLLEGSGLVGAELQIAIDGRGVGTFTVRTIIDDAASNQAPDTQQLVRLTVPAGVGAGVITVSTSGGTAVLRTGATVTTLANDVPVGDVGDTIATARVLTLGTGQRLTVQQTLGDGTQTTKDVDLYRIDLAAGEQLRLSTDGSSFYSHLRVFNAAGAALADQYMSPSGTQPLLFSAPVAGSYYVGVSGYSNLAYNPPVAGSGDNAGNSGTHKLTVERRAAGSSQLTGITATAARGTPAEATVASANVGATITLTGSGLATGEQVVFTALDTNGNLYERTVTAATVAANGLSLTVVVPNEATTGTVRLVRDQTGILLQIVPT